MIISKNNFRRDIVGGYLKEVIIVFDGWISVVLQQVIKCGIYINDVFVGKWGGLVLGIYFFIKKLK